MSAMHICSSWDPGLHTYTTVCTYLWHIRTVYECVCQSHVTRPLPFFFLHTDVTVRKRAVYAKLCVLLVYPYTCCIRVIAKFVEASHSRTVVHLQSNKCSKYWNYIGMTFKQVKESYSTRNTCVDHCMQSWIYVDIPFDCRDRLPDSQVTFHYALAHNVCIMFGLIKQCVDA